MVGKSLGRRGCPGEDNCVKFKSSVDANVCEHCPENLAQSTLDSIEGSDVVLPWIGHLLYLYGLRQVGAQFHIDDLSREEWDGLLMLESVKAELEDERAKKDELQAKVAAVKSKSSKR